MKTFFGINLTDFFKNQKDRETTVRIKFISANNIKQAKNFINTQYPQNTWSVVSDKQLDKHIVRSH